MTIKLSPVAFAIQAFFEFMAHVYAVYFCWRAERQARIEAAQEAESE